MTGMDKEGESEKSMPSAWFDDDDDDDNDDIFI